MKLLCQLLLLITVLFPFHSQAGNPANGKKTYDLHCAMCHGVSGKNVMPDAPDFTRGEGLFSSDQNLLVRIQEGKMICPGYGGILKQQVIMDVITYIRTFF